MEDTGTKVDMVVEDTGAKGATVVEAEAEAEGMVPISPRPPIMLSSMLVIPETQTCSTRHSRISRRITGNSPTPRLMNKALCKPIRPCTVVAAGCSSTRQMPWALRRPCKP